MNQLKDPRNRNYVIAGGGAAVAVIAFFLPFFTIKSVYVNYGSISGAQLGAFFWLLELLLIGAAVVSGLFIYRPHNPLGTNNIPLAKQAQWATYGILVAGGLSVVVTLLNMVNGAGYVGLVGINWGIGIFLFLLGAAATTVGGVLLATKKTIGAGGIVNYSNQYNPYDPNAQQPYPPTGYPGGYQQQQPQYPPQQTPYPPQQQTPYPPQQQQPYPPTQYPPQPPQYPQQ